MGIVKRILLHLLCAGFLVAGLASTASDPFFAQWCFAIGLGAFALAWMLPDGDRAD
jgi:hypothetical protein